VRSETASASREAIEAFINSTLLTGQSTKGIYGLLNNPSVTQGTPTFAEILNFPGNVMADNAEADGQKFAMTAEVWAKLAATAVATNAPKFVVDYESKTCIGYPYETSEDLPANSLWFGNWASVVVGVWGQGIDINLDTSTLSNEGGLRVVALQDVDVMVRLGQALAYNTAVTS
jgi:HK97 family phage major capsid protein